MKKMIGVCALATATVVLAGCWDSKNSDKNTSVALEGDTKMARTKTASGLEYEIIKEGTGVSPKAGQQVTVHYTGWLDNKGQPGAKFDSSVDRNQPFVFVVGVGQVIKGWDEGVMGMKVGEKRRLIIPAALGYGERGAGNAIPPHATLIFDVELLAIS
jgi:FKBP-type peptidyl-prolyl cis-trans isomerase FkpA